MNPSLEGEFLTTEPLGSLSEVLRLFKGIVPIFLKILHEEIYICT